MNHYETLGVERTATADQVKAAYRRAAAAAHPDREGGSHERMQAVTRAYAVLSDAERRAEYDLTGRDGSVQPIESMAIDLLTAVFSAALDADSEPVSFARRRLMDVAEMMKAQRPILASRRAALERRNGKTKVRDGHNLVQSLIERRLSAVQSEQADLENSIKANAEALRMLSSYQGEPPAQVPTYGETSNVIEALARMADMPWARGRY